MHIRVFKAARGYTMVEFIRTVYSPERKRGVNKRLGRFQIDTVLDIRATTLWRQVFTDTEQKQVLAWWSDLNSKLVAARRKERDADHARRVAGGRAEFQQAMWAICDALESGAISRLEASYVWEDMANLAAALKRGGVPKPPPITVRCTTDLLPRKDVQIPPRYAAWAAVADEYRRAQAAARA